MSVRSLDFAEPFFPVRYLVDEAEYEVGAKSIVLNLSPAGIAVRHQVLGFFRSAVFANVTLFGAARCLVIEDFEKAGDLEPLFAAMRGTWTLVYEATKLERHRGVQLYRSPKIRIGDVEVNMCFVDSVPLNVGLHRTHWGDAAFREVHTQILGYGRMQQFAERDLSTLYREDPMAPGCTHEPMYDDAWIYPWHQYEPYTKGVFLATEMGGSEEPGA